MKGLSGICCSKVADGHNDPKETKAKTCGLMEYFLRQSHDT